MEPKVVILIPAWNEAGVIGRTIESALAQTVQTQIVVIPNGCSDNTADVARQYPVTVMELPRLEHKKTEALNRAWLEHCQDANLIITMDADTDLEPHAVEKWVEEMKDPLLAGSQARFTMRLQPYEKLQDPPLREGTRAVLAGQASVRTLFPWYMRQGGTRLLTRLQKAEYALGIDRSLRKKRAGILAGASSCYRNRHLKLVMEKDGRLGPWSYESAVEDFELTYQLRKLGFRTIVSPTIRAHTDSMRNMSALKGQRLKWQTGTVEDIIRFGYDKLTRENWVQQIVGLFMALVTFTWITLFAVTMLRGGSVSLWSWWAIIPGISAVVNVKNANRIPERDWLDLLIAGTLLVGEVYGTWRLIWMVRAWFIVLKSKITKKRKDMWALQGVAEGVIESLEGLDASQVQQVG